MSSLGPGQLLALTLSIPVPIVVGWSFPSCSSLPGHMPAVGRFPTNGTARGETQSCAQCSPEPSNPLILHQGDPSTTWGHGKWRGPGAGESAPSTDVKSLCFLAHPKTLPGLSDGSPGSGTSRVAPSLLPKPPFSRAASALKKTLTSSCWCGLFGEKRGCVQWTR